MKRIIIVFAVLALAACSKKVKPSSTVTSETRSHTGFTGIDVGDAFEVYVTSDAQYSVVVESNANVHQYIYTDVVNETLKIRMEQNTSIGSGAVLRVYVSAPVYESLDLSGASSVHLENGITTSYMNMSLSGASSLEGMLSTTDFDLDASGASHISLSGTANQTNMNLSGASSFEDFVFETDQLNIDLSGASSCYVTVNSLMNVSASGASSFNYKGDGLINELDLSGGSTIEKH